MTEITYLNPNATIRKNLVPERFYISPRLSCQLCYYRSCPSKSSIQSLLPTVNHTIRTELPLRKRPLGIIFSGRATQAWVKHYIQTRRHRAKENLCERSSLYIATHFSLNKVAISLPFLSATSVLKRITATLATVRLPVSALPVCWLPDLVCIFQA